MEGSVGLVEGLVPSRVGNEMGRVGKVLGWSVALAGR